MQTDFRQEKRWKIVSAYNQARSVRDWHAASPEEKILLQVRISAPQFLSNEEGASPSSSSLTPERSSKELLNVVEEKRGSSTEMDLDADGEVDTDGDAIPPKGEADAVPIAIEEQEVATVGIVPEIKSPLKSALSAQQAAHLAELQQRQLATINYQSLLLLRAPIFDLGTNQTILDAKIFSTSSTEPNSYSTIEGLFPELPAYTIQAVDLVHDKRIDEACIFSGRLTNVSKHFDAKPLLVSTLQPSKTKQRENWTAMLGYNLEDSRDHGDGHEVPAVASRRLFDSCIRWLLTIIE